MTNKPENKEEECPNCDVHSHCSLHDPELFEDMIDTLQTPENFETRTAKKLDKDILDAIIFQAEERGRANLKKSIREEIAEKGEEWGKTILEVDTKSLVDEILSLKSLE